MIDGATLTRFADYLPKAARELIDVVGAAAAARIIARYPGRVFQVAKGKRVRGKRQLGAFAEVAGQVAADKICHHYGGNFLRVPQCKNVMRMIRDAEIRTRFDTLTAKNLHSRRAAVAMIVDEWGPIDTTTVDAIIDQPGDLVAAVAPRRSEEPQLGLF